MLRRAAVAATCVGLGAISWTYKTTRLDGEVLDRTYRNSISASASPTSHSVATSRKYRVGVLGATGAVGQRFIQLLEGHPWFEVHAVGASKRSVGKSYTDAAKWLLGTDPPSNVKDLKVVPCTSKAFADCDFVFSALDASVAGEIEAEFVREGIPVFSNARNFRMHRDVPLIVPPVNDGHLDMVEWQDSLSKKGGFIVTNANCSTTGLVIALKPIADKFGIDAVCVSTMQAVSGAGYPGLSNLDIEGNVIPNISGEEGKLESEYRKIMGKLHKDGSIEEANFALSASTHRVNVRDGHTLSVSVRTKTPATAKDIEEAFRTWQPSPLLRSLPSAPESFIRVRSEKDRPQPRIDTAEGNGLTTVIGQVRPCSVLGTKFLAVSHNTMMGAAGSSILNAELAAAKGLFPGKN